MDTNRWTFIKHIYKTHASLCFYCLIADKYLCFLICSTLINAKLKSALISTLRQTSCSFKLILGVWFVKKSELSEIWKILNKKYFQFFFLSVTSLNFVSVKKIKYKVYYILFVYKRLCWFGFDKLVNVLISIDMQKLIWKQKTINWWHSNISIFFVYIFFVYYGFGWNIPSA